MILVTSLLHAGAHRPQKLADMIGSVDVIAIVKIRAVDLPRIEFEVTEIVSGNLTKGNHSTEYNLPPLEHGGIRFHIAIPGSGIEKSLIPEEQYIFLFKRDKALEMIRAERLSELENVKQAWEKKSEQATPSNR